MDRKGGRPHGHQRSPLIRARGVCQLSGGKCALVPVPDEGGIWSQVHQRRPLAGLAEYGVHSTHHGTEPGPIGSGPRRKS
jgi:hypothetical protein